MKSFRKHLLLGALVLGLGTSAFAADATSCEPMEPMMRGHRMMNQADRAKMDARMKVHMERRQAALHDKLKLTAEQEPAWKEFVAGAKPPMMGQRMAPEDWKKLTAPERMEKMVEHMKQREAHMTERLAALKKFYAVLTPEQQKVFDAEHFGPHQRPMKRGHKRGPAPAAQ